MVDVDAVKSEFGEILLNISVELGRIKVTINEMLAWENGTIIRLNKTSGEPVDFLVNGTPLAVGEMMVLDEKFAIRITDILTEEMLTEKFKDKLYET